jgi:hypothetical protein
MIHFYSENNQIGLHYLSLIYFVSQHLHVSGMFNNHHQEVFAVYVQQLVSVICLTLSVPN